MLKPGDVLQGRYVCQERLGSGGQGSVFAASDLRLPEKRWAIKELIQPEAEIAERAKRQSEQETSAAPATPAASPAAQKAKSQFRQEAHALTILHNDGLPDVADFFDENDNSYLVMELIAGDDLAKFVHANKGPLTAPQVTGIGMQICTILEYLHSRTPLPVVHRDIKPANIKLQPNGHVRLVDFGLAKMAAPGMVSGQTIRGSGTPGFAPIEQYAGQGGTDARSDLYALAACLYFLATAVNPVDAPSRVSNPQALRSVRSLNPAIPSGLAQVIAKGMSMRKEDRYQTAAEFRDALEQSTKAPVVPKRCVNCGEDVPGGVSNCPRCGTPINAKKATSATVPAGMIGLAAAGVIAALILVAAPLQLMAVSMAQTQKVLLAALVTPLPAVVAVLALLFLRRARATQSVTNWAWYAIVVLTALCVVLTVLVWLVDGASSPRLQELIIVINGLCGVVAVVVALLAQSSPVDGSLRPTSALKS